MQSIFKNLNLSEVYESGLWTDMYTTPKQHIFHISSLIFLCSKGCGKVITKNGASEYSALDNAGYAALSKQIRKLAQSAFDASDDTVDDVDFFHDDLPGSEIAEWAETGFKNLPGKKQVTLLQIHAMAALWTIDEALSIINEEGWCDRAVELVLHASDFERACIAIEKDKPEVSGSTDLANFETTIRQARREIAMKGAQATHARTRAMKDEAQRLYLEGKWSSILQAAIAITPQVQAFGQAHFSRPLSQDRAQQTVYEWLLKLEKQLLKN